jgi:hypothetical protein
VVLGFVGAAVGASLSQPPVYEASATVIVGQEMPEQASWEIVPIPPAGGTRLQVLTHEIAARELPPSVAEEAIRQAGQQGIRTSANRLATFHTWQLSE